MEHQTKQKKMENNGMECIKKKTIKFLTEKGGL